VPDEVNLIRAFIGKHLNIQRPALNTAWVFSGLMLEYAKLRSEIRTGVFSIEEYIRLSKMLDVKLQALDLEMPPSWQYSTTLLGHRSDRTLDFYFHSYSNPRVCQARNILRLVRILLNESLIAYYLESPANDKYLALIGVALDSIKLLAGEICASVPQYVDCDGAARQKLPRSERSELQDQTADCIQDRGHVAVGHHHTPIHQLECYTTIFPLYIAGRFDGAPEVRPWVIKQLRYISGHFYVRNAEVVAQILEQEINVNPWDVYAMLGSYAFAT